MISINGAIAEVEFSRFDLEAYGLFLRAKKLPESQTPRTPARMDSAKRLQT